MIGLVEGPNKVGCLQRMVSSNCTKWIGDGLCTSFWHENWGPFDRCLKELYPRLFQIESRKDVCVADRVKVEDGKKVVNGSGGRHFLYGKMGK